MARQARPARIAIARPMPDLDLCYTPATELAQLDPERELSPGRARRRTASSGSTQRRTRSSTASASSIREEALDLAREAERRSRAGDELGAAARRPDRDQGSDADEGQAHDHGLVRVRAPRSRDDRRCSSSSFSDAGAIMVGKTTTPEFAYSSFTDSPLWGITRNPWNPERTPGGSSGGSGAAVASGCVPLAEGTDMGGSVRIPASWSGLVGLKPSFGRIPLDFLPTQFDTIQHFGPLARTIADARLFLAVAPGARRSRHHVARAGRSTCPAPSTRRPGGLRLALDVDLGHYAVAPEVEAAYATPRRRSPTQAPSSRRSTSAGPASSPTRGSTHWGVYLAAIFGHVLPEYRDRMDPRAARASSTTGSP